MALTIEPNPNPRGGHHVVSWSEISTYRACPHKHELAYLERWSYTAPDTTPLGRGILWHKTLEMHYLALMTGAVDPRPAVAAQFKAWVAEGRDTDVIDLIEWMYLGHFETYGTDETWEIVAVEFPFEFPLRTPAGRRTRFTVKGKVDLVVRDRSTRRTAVVDHKSCANLPKQRELDLDDQMGLYLWGLRSLGYNPFMAVYSAARTTRNKGDYPGAVDEWLRAKAVGEKPGARPKQQTLDERFDRYMLARTDVELDNIEQETLATARAMYSASNVHERHPDSDRCRWSCGFMEACLFGRKTTPQREREFLHDIGFRQNFQRH